MSNISAVILGAGRSIRMKSALPKVLHPVCGRPLVAYTLRAVEEFYQLHCSCLIHQANRIPINRATTISENADANQIILVISPEFKKEFEELWLRHLCRYKNLVFAVQKEQLGTADAVKSAATKICKECEYVLIIPGDVPLIKSETLKKLSQETISKEAVCGLLTMEMSDPASYGRIVRNDKGGVTAIIEARDASYDQLTIREVNSGIYCVKSSWLFKALKKITPKNAQKEYYLTDIIKIAEEEGKNVAAFCVSDSLEIMGVNTRKELAQANRLMRHKILDKMMAEGVGILDELNTYIDDCVEIGVDTTIYPNCFISGQTKIGKNCVIENGVVIKNSKIGGDVHIKSYSVIEDSEIKDTAQIGPFARLRPGTVIENEVKVGNFVEIKKSVIKKGAKASHLSYIGDAVIGERTNVGCGTITCNYDGKNKHKTVIGNDVLIGSAVQFVAPIEVGNGAIIGAGSTITENVPENSLAIARERQVVKKNWKK